MNLNQLIDKLVKFRDENNAGEKEVFNTELVYDVMCGEIQDVYQEPINMKDEDIIMNEYGVFFYAQNNKTEY